MSNWQVFWVCAAVVACVFILSEAWLTSQGLDTRLWAHKTPIELEIQKSKVSSAKAPESKDQGQ